MGSLWKLAGVVAVVYFVVLPALADDVAKMRGRVSSAPPNPSWKPPLPGGRTAARDNALTTPWTAPPPDPVIYEGMRIKVPLTVRTVSR